MSIAITTTILLLLLATTIHALPLTSADKPSQTTQSYSLNDMIPSIWLNAATYSLLCYDAVAVGLLCWLWLCGHLVWMKEGTRTGYERGIEMREIEWAGQRRGRQTLIEGEMRRLGMI